MFFRVAQLPHAASQADVDLMHAINNLIRSFGELKHLVWMSRDVYKFISNNLGLGEYDKRILEAINESNAELGRFHKELKVHFEVDLNDKFRQEFCEQSSCFYIGYGLIADSAYVQPPKILAEADFDFEMCKHATDAWIQKNASYKKIFSCKFGFINGAGGNLFRGYYRASENREFFICLIDSDKKHPSDFFGGTADALVKLPFTNRRNHQICILEATEMENIIPLKIMEEAIRQCGNEEACKNDLLEMARSEYRLFFDHKLGIKTAKARELDDKFGEYWSNSKFYKEESEWLCRGFANNVGDHCLRLMNERTPAKNAESVCEVKDKYWLFLGELLFAWGVGFKKSVV